METLANVNFEVLEEEDLMEVEGGIVPAVIGGAVFIIGAWFGSR